MQTVGAAGILACGIAARNSVSYGCLQWCGQECPHLLQLASSSQFLSFDTASFILLVISRIIPLNCRRGGCGRH